MDTRDNKIREQRLEALLTYLKNRESVTIAEIKNSLGYQDRRMVRKDVEILRSLGEPICSGDYGYRYTTDLNEIQNTINRLMRNANGILTTTKALSDTIQVLKAKGQLA